MQKPKNPEVLPSWSPKELTLRIFSTLLVETLKSSSHKLLPTNVPLAIVHMTGIRRSHLKRRGVYQGKACTRNNECLFNTHSIVHEEELGNRASKTEDNPQITHISI